MSLNSKIRRISASDLPVGTLSTNTLRKILKANDVFLEIPESVSWDEVAAGRREESLNFRGHGLVVDIERLLISFKCDELGTDQIQVNLENFEAFNNGVLAWTETSTNSVVYLSHHGKLIVSIKDRPLVVVRASKDSIFQLGRLHEEIRFRTIRHKMARKFSLPGYNKPKPAWS